MRTRFQKGDVVIRAYAHEPEEWGIVIDLETVIVDPQIGSASEDHIFEDLLEDVYVTVLWPGYTTQEIDYELSTVVEALEYSVRYYEKLEKENKRK